MLTVYVLDRRVYESVRGIYDDDTTCPAGLSVVCGDIFGAADSYDCMVTAGNSFGMMDGGIDGTANYFFGHIESAVQEAIVRDWAGELPVGAAIVLHVKPQPLRARCRYMCYAPTMRVPGPCDPTSLQAYHAMRGALVSIRACSNDKQVAIERIDRIAVPLLCHGVGGMPVAKVLVQIRAAYESVESAPLPRDWHDINAQHAALMDA